MDKAIQNQVRFHAALIRHHYAPGIVPVSVVYMLTVFINRAYGLAFGKESNELGELHNLCYQECTSTEAVRLLEVP